MHPTQARPGQIGGRFIIQNPIGEGGAGQVFLAYDSALNRWVAIKRLRSDTPEGSRRAEMALREASRLAALQHPNIITVHDCIPDGDAVAVVMEYVPGQTLEELTTQGFLDLNDFRQVARQCLNGLSAAHSAGILHRDIKGSNILLGRDSAGHLLVKILDFGLAKEINIPSVQTIDHSGSLLGSIHTMAPEQFDKRPLDARTDLYSLGCVFYQCLSAREPFDGATVAEIIAAHLNGRFIPLSEIRPDLPLSICSWIESLIQQDPANRPASAIEASNLLEAAFQSSPAPVPSGSDSVAAKRRPALAFVIGALLAAAAIPAAIAFLPRPSARETGGEGMASGSLAAASDTVPQRPQAPDQSATDAGNDLRVLQASDTSEILSKVGCRVRVEGVVSRIGRSRSGDVLFVNFEGNDRGDFSLVFFPGALDVEKAREELQQFVGKRVSVEGLITLHRNSPQIEIRGPQDIRILL